MPNEAPPNSGIEHLTEGIERLTVETFATLNRLALVAQKTSNAVLICDNKGQIEWANHGFTALTGYTLNEIIGRKPKDFLHGEKTDSATVRAMGKALRKQQAFEGEIYNYRKNGQGLAISHHVIVEKHQGQLTFETEPGRGTTFIIRLPLAQPTE